MFFKIAEVSERNACSLKIDFMNRRGAHCFPMRLAGWLFIFCACMHMHFG